MRSAPWPNACARRSTARSRGRPAFWNSPNQAPAGASARPSRPTRSSPGQPINGVYLLSTDVTEEAQARAALAQTHKRELAAQLTSGLAHDFANLLTIILGLQGRLEKLPLPDGAKELIGATQTAARRGGLLLDKIARMSGPIEMRPAPVVLRDFLDSFAPLARAPLPPAITFAFDCEVAHGASCSTPGAFRTAF
jgi:signal transduction histidine kinase